MHIAEFRQIPSGIFAYTLHPTRLAMLTEGATAEERSFAEAHWAYSRQLLVDGVLVFGGRTLIATADSFAMVIVRAPSSEAARAIAEADPAVRGGVFRSVVYPFQPMLMGAWPPEAANEEAGDAIPHAGVHFPPPLLYVAGLVVGWGLNRWRPLPMTDGGSLGRTSVAAAFLIAYLALFLAAFLAFRRARTTIIPNRPAATLVTGDCIVSRGIRCTSVSSFSIWESHFL